MNTASQNQSHTNQPSTSPNSRIENLRRRMSDPNFVDWYFVTRPIIQGRHQYVGIPISQNFRTVSEAEKWLDECGYDDAYVAFHSAAIGPQSREEIEMYVFDDECPAKAICYTYEPIPA